MSRSRGAIKSALAMAFASGLSLLGAAGASAQSQANLNAQDTRPAPKQFIAPRDPNLPGNIFNSKISVAYQGPGAAIPTIILRGTINRMGSASPYLGYNDEGSWLQNPIDAKIYVWNLKANAVTERFGNYKLIPEAILRSLRHPDKDAELAAENADPQPPPASPPPSPPKSEDFTRALLGEPGQGIAELQARALQKLPSAAPSSKGAGLTGTGAKIRAGVLSFTLGSGATVTYKVIRPKAMASDPQAYVDTTGTWIAPEENGNGILFTVQGDRTLSGKEMPAQVIQMLVH